MNGEVSDTFFCSDEITIGDKIKILSNELKETKDEKFLKSFRTLKEDVLDAEEISFLDMNKENSDIKFLEIIIDSDLDELILNTDSLQKYIEENFEYKMVPDIDSVYDEMKEEERAGLI